MPIKPMSRSGVRNAGMRLPQPPNSALLYMSFFETILSKPIFAAGTGVGAVIGTWLGVLTPVVGFLAALVALGASIYGLIHKRNQVLKDELEIERLKNRLCLY